MILSCCIWALSEPETVAHTKLKDLGFTAFDIRPSLLRSDEANASRKNLGFDLCCIALTHDRPEGAKIDTDDADRVKLALDHVKDGLDHAARLGIQWGYLVPEPPGDDRTPDRYAEHYAEIAEHGKSRGIKVCIEHFPGTTFPTVASTLDFIAKTGHDNLYLLFDIGHAQMADEDPKAELSAAGDRVGYVHLADHDGVGDLHLGLTDGVMTKDSLAYLFQALQEIDYVGPVSLEMKDDLPDPFDAIDRSQQIVRRLANVS